MPRGLTKDQLDWLDLAKNNPVAFGWECGFTDLTDLHNDWMRKMLYSPKDQTYQSHRGSYKTTTISIVLALSAILFPSEISIFMRKTDNDVKEIIRQVQIMLMSDFFQAFSYGLYGQSVKLTTGTATEVNTSLQAANRGAPQLLGIGSRSSLTGKHCDRMYTDDIINIEDRISYTERERTKLVYQELQNIRNRDGKIINTGTPWHPDDAFMIMPNIERYDCYSTGLISKEQLDRLSASMSPTLFAANYELKHIADGHRMFTDPKMANVDQMVQFRRSGNPLYCHMDASYAGEDGSALSCAKEIDGGTVVVHGELRKGHIERHLAGFEARIRYLGGDSVMMEMNSDKGWLARETDLKPLPYHESTNKDIKISTYLRGRWSDIVFTPETDPEYINQILEYMVGVRHDDAPDSLASAIRALENKSRVRRVDRHSREAVKFFKGLGF